MYVINLNSLLHPMLSSGFPVTEMLSFSCGQDLIGDELLVC